VASVKKRLLTITDVWLDNQRIDVLINDGVIEAIHPTARTSTELGPGPGRASGNREQIDGRGLSILPGLHDHHLHLFATEAARTSIDCAAHSDRLGSAFRDAQPANGWIRATGYFETMMGHLDCDAIDRLRSDVPVRIQHRSGVAWFVNSAAIDTLGIAEANIGEPEGLERDRNGRATGRLFRMDTWLAGKLPTTIADLSVISGELSAYGVTRVTDATPFATRDELVSLVTQSVDGRLRQHLSTMGSTAITDVQDLQRVAAKVMLDESRLGSLEGLRADIEAMHSIGLPVAIHATDRSTAWLAITAFEEAGTLSGDRIEHGAVLDDGAVAKCSALTITVVTNPALAQLRSDDHFTLTQESDRPLLWRCQSLLEAGVPVLAGTDAPYGPLDPWKSMRAATQRTTPAGHRVGTDMPISHRDAFALFRPSNAIRVGQPADMLLASGTPGEVLDDLDASRVTHTIIGGELVWSRP
jgi:predicted amidohydrolase YtcJ